MRMARLIVNLLGPHLKSGATLDPQDYMLFPDDAHSLPDDVDAKERAWMLKLDRSAD